MKPATQLLRFDAAPGDPYRPLSTPIYQTATFAQTSALEFGPYDYSRSGNPTRSVLERQLAALEGAQYASAFGSGMAALTTLTRLAAGGRILAGDDLYGGTYRLLSRISAHQDIAVDYVDATDLDAVGAALRSPTKLVLVETPTNPLLRVLDLPSLARLCHERGALLAVDNSLLSPLLQQPLGIGADLALHSATKFLCGHGDVTAGAIATNDSDLASRISFLQNAEGNALAPFDSWLLLRGLKTLHLRVREQQRNARRIAAFLGRQPAIRNLRYPGRGSVLCFETGDIETSRRLVESLRLFTIAVSFGSVHSTVSLPCRMSHASIPEAIRRSRHLPEDLVRLSIGIEDADDLLEDLAQALEALMPRAARS
ncbi:MAG: aminotransferase class I/II-fold pyridoxal phosphate-dependent enzyme [Planctomycetota bacterium]|nr:MAG: aminotransferase class I/II-fold pyridoxal phosphate-dependent enzyme [Planctomycetota bacterium]